MLESLLQLRMGILAVMAYSPNEIVKKSGWIAKFDATPIPPLPEALCYEKRVKMACSKQQHARTSRLPYTAIFDSRTRLFRDYRKSDGDFYARSLDR